MLNRLLNEKNFIILSGVFQAVFLFDLFFPLPSMKPYSKMIYAKDGSLLTAYLTQDDKWRMKAGLKGISEEMKKAIIEKEDKYFYMHPGINPVSIARALFSNITSGKRVSGASTITMQLVRLMERRNRNYLNKLIEAVRAVQYELHYTKNEILEMYLSLLPYGGNIEGVESASYLYYNKAPAALSLAEAVTLSVIPNSPGQFNFNNTGNILNARNKLLKRFLRNKTFPLWEIKDALSEPVTARRYNIPRHAPQFCNFLNRTVKKNEVYTSLNRQIQVKAENLLSNHIQRLYFSGITNGAVLVINNKTHLIEAYCGSADFNNSAASGQVDGVKSIRSPGSTLKPFLYAHAFNTGSYTPKMKIPDIPTDFSGYSPENFDLKFNGFVTCEFALENSLNVPAVRLLNEVGFDDFISLLEQGGLQEIKKDRSKLGLSLILGGCGVSLEQLTSFYSVFAGKGILYPAGYFTDNTKVKMKPRRLFSESVSFIISDILSKNKRPDLPAEYIGVSKLPKIAWKTGTSYGKRDAWAVGYNPDYTVGVWIGNFNAKGSPDISGAKIAVPLLFDIFNSIDYNANDKWFSIPEEVQERLVCSESGLLPAGCCRNFITDYYIENTSHNKICNIEKEIYINSDSTIEYCPACLPDSGYQKAVFSFYPPELETWFSDNGYSKIKHPDHNPECTIKYSDSAPVIISPSEDYEYYIERNSTDQIMLKAAGYESKMYYWYINDNFYGKAPGEETLFFIPKRGKTKVTCIDEQGRDKSILINVKYY